MDDKLVRRLKFEKIVDTTWHVRGAYVLVGGSLLHLDLLSFL